MPGPEHGGDELLSQRARDLHDVPAEAEDEWLSDVPVAHVGIYRRTAHGLPADPGPAAGERVVQILAVRLRRAGTRHGHSPPRGQLRLLSGRPVHGDHLSVAGHLRPAVRSRARQAPRGRRQHEGESKKFGCSSPTLFRPTRYVHRILFVLDCRRTFSS